MKEELFEIPIKYRNGNYLTEEHYDLANKKIPKSLGIDLVRLYEDSKYVICTHKTSVIEATIKDIFTNGLKNAGQNEINHTATVNRSLPQLIHEVNSYGWHGQRYFSGVFIIKIPKAYLALGKGEVKPIWFDSKEKVYPHDVMRLLPEYIYGYVDTEKGNFSSIIKNPNYLDIHTYENGDLLYDERVINEQKKEDLLRLLR